MGPLRPATPAASVSEANGTPMVDRYESVGLRGNPFAGGHIDAETDPRLFVPRGLPDRPPPPGTGAFLQVIGERGAGKSTHVNRWRRSEPGPLHYIPRAPYAQRWRRPPVGPLVYGDEIDRMPGPLRRRWFSLLARQGATLVIGTHEDLSGLARRAGFGQDGATLATYRLGPIDRVTLDDLLDARLRAASVGGTDPTELLTIADRARIYAGANGSIRRAQTIGHELIAERVR